MFGELAEPDAEALKAFRQGDVLETLVKVEVLGPDGDGIMVPTPLGVVLVSQTCDVVLPNRAAVQIAPHVRLPASAADDARDGRRPRYAHLPQLGACDFADLEVVTTVAKRNLVGLRRRPGVESDEEIRRFAGAVARKFGRFAFPDEVSWWLRPLEEVVASKARKAASPERVALEHVVELRVEASGGWGTAPYDLTLCVIVEPGTLPTFPGDELPDLPSSLDEWLHNPVGELRRASGEIADRLAKATDSADRYWLWMALGEAWGNRCRPPANAPSAVHEAVLGVTAEVVPADEFPLTRVRRSEILDLDHISGPTPEL